jgi:DNA-binding NtrC family response regulator
VLLIKGLSPEWLEVERLIEQTSPTHAPVLVQGESGTGKELVANAIHFNSARSSEPFVVVNCAAIPDQLLESTLFGHERGAFTGATTRKAGEFQKADGGTLFLDEVGELSPTLQPKVLRAVEYGDVMPLGSSGASRKVDVRLICATNRDLPAMVRDGRFREDLFYRVSLVTMQLPPLRSYKSNLPILARVLLRQAARKHAKRVSGISAPALELLESHDFPGNVRELRNAVEHAVIMATSDEIRIEDLPRSIGPSLQVDPEPEPRRRTLRQEREAWLAPLEKRYLADLLTECGGNVRRAAALAGINTVTMYRLLRKRGLRLDRRVSG